MLTEQPRCAEALGIHLVHQRISILRDRGSVNDDLEYFGDLLQEIVDLWSLQNVDVAGAALHLDWNDVVGILNEVEL